MTVRTSIYKSVLYGYNKNALAELKKYVIDGEFDENGLKDNEVILSVLHMDDTKRKISTPAIIRRGLRLCSTGQGMRSG
ncbi:hypothetical protein LC724_00845 [Blautia sp. RD014234]|nr:hypothetical protein [Blautia parvula]